MLASELPVPLTEICAWGEYLLPAGFRGGLAGALFSSTGRHVGFVSLLGEDPARPGPADRQILAEVTRVIADAVLEGKTMRPEDANAAPAGGNGKAAAPAEVLPGAVARAREAFVAGG